MRLSPLPVLLALAGVVVAPSVVADELPRVMRLEVHRGPGAEACPADEVLHDVLSSRMSWDPILASAPARLVASLSKRGRLYVGRAEIRSGDARVLWSRDLDPIADCTSVVEGLGFVTALRLDPAGPLAARAPVATVAAVAPPSPAAPARVVAPVLPAPVVAPDKQVTPPSPVPIASAPASPALDAAPVAVELAPVDTWPKLEVSLAGGVGFGVSPAPVAGIAAIDVGLRWPILSAALELRAFPLASGPGSTGAEITTGLYSVAAIGCAHWRALAGCGMFDVGALRASAPAAHPTTGVVASFRAGVRAAAGLPLSEVFAIRVTGDALLPIQRAALRLDGATVWTAPVLAGGVQAGIVVSF